MDHHSSRPQFGSTEIRNAQELIKLALAEDLGPEGDVTSLATIPEATLGTALITSRADGVISGLPLISLLIEAMSSSLRWSPKRDEGAGLTKGSIVGILNGPMHELLVLERTALNFLQRLSGIASLTSQFVLAVAGTKATILDTRKTTPGWRALEKYAVRCGGGANHRMSLSDMILIKDNHLASAGGDIASVVLAARLFGGERLRIELEVDSLEQFDQALIAQPDIILVDNLGAESLGEAVRRRNLHAPGIQLEASGGVTLTTVRSLAETGVDRISVGALTHSAPALDLGLDFSRSLKA